MTRSLRRKGRPTRRSRRRLPVGGPSFRELEFSARPRRAQTLRRAEESPSSWIGLPPAVAPIRAVRVAVQPLLVTPEIPDPSEAAINELAATLTQVEELGVRRNGRAWELYGDGEFVGTLARPAYVPLARVLAPPSSPVENPSVGWGMIPEFLSIA